MNNKKPLKGNEKVLARKGIFYLVWKNNGGIPTTVHPHLERAQSEAERLSKKHHGEKFYVLKALAFCMEKEKVVWSLLPGIKEV